MGPSDEYKKYAVPFSGVILGKVDFGSIIGIKSLTYTVGQVGSNQITNAPLFGKQGQVELIRGNN